MLQLLTSLTLALPGFAPTATPAVPAPTAQPAALSALGLLPDYATDKRAALKTYVDEVEALAAWCQKNKAYLERNRAYELLIEHQPEHKVARKALGYTYDRKAEEWVRKRPYRAPKNAKPAAALEALEMREKLFADHTNRLIAAIEKNIDTIDEKTKKADLKPLLEERPDDERLRALLGQVRVAEDGKADRWVSEAAKAGMSRRQELKSMRTEGRKSAPEPTETEPEDQENVSGITWKTALDNQTMRVLSTGSSSEAERILTNVHMLWGYMPKLLGGSVNVSDDSTIYILADSSARETFRDNSPLVSESNREYWDKTVGTFLGTTTRMALYSGNTDGRVDMALRLTIGLYMWQNYGIKGERGWATEGFGLYLVHQIVGTRLSYTLNDGEYEDTSDRNYAERIERADADWLELARRMLRDKKAPNLAFVLGKDVGALAPRDLIISNALAAYLIEGKGPEVTANVLRRIGGKWENGELTTDGEAAVKVLEDELGAPLPEIYVLLEEWLTEMKRK